MCSAPKTKNVFTLNKLSKRRSAKKKRAFRTEFKQNEKMNLYFSILQKNDAAAFPCLNYENKSNGVSSLPGQTNGSTKGEYKVTSDRP